MTTQLTPELVQAALWSALVGVAWYHGYLRGRIVELRSDLIKWREAVERTDKLVESIRHGREQRG